MTRLENAKAYITAWELRKESPLCLHIPTELNELYRALSEILAILETYGRENTCTVPGRD